MSESIVSIKIESLTRSFKNSLAESLRNETFGPTRKTTDFDLQPVASNLSMLSNTLISSNSTALSTHRGGPCSASLICEGEAEMMDVEASTQFVKSFSEMNVEQLSQEDYFMSDYLQSLDEWVLSNDGSSKESKEMARGRILEFLADEDEDVLELSYLPLYTIPPLFGLTKMIRLFINNTRISFLHKEDFRGLSHLEDLTLAGNSLLELGDDVFGYLESLEILELHCNQISKIPPFAFRGLDKLLELNLRNNKISSFDGVFMPFQKSLEKLFVRGNYFTDAKWVVQFPNLRYLYLGDNFIASIDNVSWSLLPCLEHLDIARNKLTSLKNVFFPAWSSMYKINLAGNSIGDLSEHTFSRMSSLFSLFLQDNRLGQMAKLIDWSKLRELVTINLSGNGIFSTEGFDFSLCKNLSHIILTKNALVLLECRLPERGNVSVHLGGNPVDFDSLPRSADSKYPVFTFDSEENRGYYECRLDQV